MNKRAVSLSGWTEGILLVLLFVGIFAIVIAGLNSMYGQNNDIGLGTNTTQEAYQAYQDTLDSQIRGGEAEFTSNDGLTLKSSWAIIKSGTTIIWGFFTAGWIESIVDYMNLPTAVAVTFRILFFLSLGYIILKILFKVKP